MFCPLPSCRLQTPRRDGNDRANKLGQLEPSSRALGMVACAMFLLVWKSLVSRSGSLPNGRHVCLSRPTFAVVAETSLVPDCASFLSGQQTSPSVDPSRWQARLNVNIKYIDAYLLPIFSLFFPNRNADCRELLTSNCQRIYLARHDQLVPYSLCPIWQNIKFKRKVGINTFSFNIKIFLPNRCRDL